MGTHPVVRLARYLRGLSWSTRGDANFKRLQCGLDGRRQFIDRFSGPVLPDGRVATAVEYGQNDDSSFFRSKVDAKWEPIGNDTANIHVNRRVGHRPLSGGSHTSFDFGNELHAKVWPLAFVPCRRFDEFRAGRTTKRNR